MDINQYRIAYHSQKSNAAQRGIGFHLTFPEWCEFWGSDIERRGNGPNDLQMQRYADTGPYAIGNIRKGTPKQNAITRENMAKKHACKSASDELNAALDAEMNSESRVDFDSDGREAHYGSLGLRSSYKSRYHYATR